MIGTLLRNKFSFVFILMIMTTFLISSCQKKQSVEEPKKQETTKETTKVDKEDKKEVVKEDDADVDEPVEKDSSKPIEKDKVGNVNKQEEELIMEMDSINKPRHDSEPISSSAPKVSENKEN